MTRCADTARRPDEQRLVDIASILAAGMLRLQECQSLPIAEIASNPGDSSPHCPQIVPPKKRVCSEVVEAEVLPRFLSLSCGKRDFVDFRSNMEINCKSVFMGCVFEFTRAFNSLTSTHGVPALL